MNKIISAIILLSTLLFPQSGFNRDSVFNQFMGLKEAKLNASEPASKCNFSLINTVRSNFSRFTEQQRSLMKPLLQRPVTQTSIVSPSGFFRIHFDTSGTSAVQYDINEFARAADSAYSFEVTTLGFPPPPPDSEGGDNKYDVYITETGSSYGSTQFSFNDNQKGPSYIEMHYAFDTGFFTHGINAARVTIAHEFHHAIQIGNYIFRSDDQWFYELTSTSMEDFVFTTVNDYYAYMTHYFNSPDKPIYKFSDNFDGYDVAIWNIYLVKKYGFSILLEQWQYMPQMRALNAIDKTLNERESNLTVSLNEFGIWCYYTGPKANPAKYFNEGAAYPRLVYSYSRTVPNAIIDKSSNFVANNFFRIAYPHTNDVDTLITIVTNGDIPSALATPGLESTFHLGVYTTPGHPDEINVGNIFYLTLDAPGTFWMNSEILNDSIAGTNNPVNEADFVFPNPFRYTSNSFIYVPVSPNLTGEVDLNIYTASMDLVYSSTKFITKPYGRPVVKWDGKNSSSNKLASGVYIYVAKSGDTISKGKIVIFND